MILVPVCLWLQTLVAHDYVPLHPAMAVRMRVPWQLSFTISPGVKMCGVPNQCSRCISIRRQNGRD